jgi:hypothetical protein
VSGFAWASAASGARSSCPPAPRQGRVATARPSLPRCQVGVLWDDVRGRSDGSGG